MAKIFAARGHGAPKAHRGSQKPPMKTIAPIATGKSEIRMPNRNPQGFAGVAPLSDRENKKFKGASKSRVLL